MNNIIKAGLLIGLTGMFACMGVEAGGETGGETGGDSSPADAGSSSESAETTPSSTPDPDPVTAEQAANETPKAEGDWSAGDTIPSGKPGVPDIQILEVHQNGTGAVCGNGKTATLAYKAMLIDGTVIDPGTRPFTFKVGAGRAIEGWDVIVAKMRVGDSFTLTLPEQLAYGPSKGDLKFDMELLSVR